MKVLELLQGARCRCLASVAWSYGNFSEHDRDRIGSGGVKRALIRRERWATCRHRNALSSEISETVAVCYTSHLLALRLSVSQVMTTSNHAGGHMACE